MIIANRPPPRDSIQHRRPGWVSDSYSAPTILGVTFHESEQEITLREGKQFGRFALQQFAVGADLISFRVHVDLRQGVIPFKIFLSELSAAADGLNALAQAVATGDALALAGLADKGDRTKRRCLSETAEHRPHENGLRCRDARIGIAHLCPRDDAAFD